MMVQVFKSAVGRGHSIFGGSVIMHWQALWIWTLTKLQCLTVQAFCVCSLLSLWFGYHQCWIFGIRKPLIVHCAYINEYIYKFSAYINIYKHFGKSSDSREHPTPPHGVAPTIRASARNMMLRSTDHVCKCKEHYHPHPTPPIPLLA